MSIIPRIIAVEKDWKVTTQPLLEPVTVDELKIFARIDSTTEDHLLTGFIKAARKAAELWLGRSLIQQTITLSMDNWVEWGYSQGSWGEIRRTDNKMILPQPPLISVTVVRTLDEDDTATTYSSDNYYVVTSKDPGELVIKQSVTPPTNTDRASGGYEVVYLAGYGTNASDVPEGIKEGIKLWATDIYENRETGSTPPPAAMPILQPYRIYDI